MTSRFIQHVVRYISNAIQTQLILTIVATPILVAWGLGTSLMTFVGNIIFTPLLALFLMLSSMLFFTELFGIPNGTLIWLLEQVTLWWHNLLLHSQQSWLFTAAYPGKIPLSLSVLIALWLLKHPQLRSPQKKIMAMSCIILAMGMGLWLFTAYRQHACGNQTITFNKQHRGYGNLSLVTIDGIRVLVDNGFYVGKKSAGHAITFELKPYLITRTGKATIDTLIMTTPSLGSFEAATELSKTCGVNKIFLAYTKKQICQHAWKVWYDLERYAANHNITVYRWIPSPDELTPEGAIKLAQKSLGLHQK